MSAGPDNISDAARIIDTDAQGNKVILREGGKRLHVHAGQNCRH